MYRYDNYKFHVRCHAIKFKSNSSRKTAEYIIDCLSNVVGISFTDLQETSNNFNYWALYDVAANKDVELLTRKLEYAYRCVEEKIKNRRL